MPDNSLNNDAKNDIAAIIAKKSRAYNDARTKLYGWSTMRTIEQSVASYLKSEKELIGKLCGLDELEQKARNDYYNKSKDWKAMYSRLFGN